MDIFHQKVVFFTMGFLLSACAFGEHSPREVLLSVKAENEYRLNSDEEWPEEVAHLFPDGQRGNSREDAESKGSRKRRWTEWVSDKHEFREDSWDELNPTMMKPTPTPKFIIYQSNGTFVMSRCASWSGAVTLVIACPQPRGSKFHRVINFKKAIYGWSQHGGDVCQYVEGDCTKRYEFLHKQIMRPTTPQNADEWKSLGPTYFCNEWPGGNGRERWEFGSKRWCSIGLKRASQIPDPKKDVTNPWRKKYLYTWNAQDCGSPYNWFDYLHVEYTCDDVMEPINPEATRPYHYRPHPNCKKSPIKPAPTDTSTSETTESS